MSTQFHDGFGTEYRSAVFARVRASSALALAWVLTVTTTYRTSSVRWSSSPVARIPTSRLANAHGCGSHGRTWDRTRERSQVASRTSAFKQEHARSGGDHVARARVADWV
jgi:hypothetical protein